MREWTAPATIRERAESDGRSVEIRIMPWDTVAETPEGREAFSRGAFSAVDARRVTLESQRHGGTLVGRGESIVEHDDAAYLFGRVSETAAGDELLTLIRDGVVTEASVAFIPSKTTRRKGVLVRESVDLRRVAILERGSYPGAGVVAVRSQTEGKPVIETVDDQLPAPANDADRQIRAAIEPLLERMGTLDDRMIKLASSAAIPAPYDAPESWHTRSLGDHLLASIEIAHTRERADMPSLFARAVGDAYQTIRERALLDQITPDNPGLIPPAHLTEAVGILNAGRPTVEAFGGARSVPDSGMDIDWPQLVPLAGRAIAKQSAQKTEVVSRKISFARGVATLATYAGASDIAIQLLRRSSPSYRELFAQVMLAEYARVTDDQFADDILAASGIQTIDYDPATDTTGAGFRAALVQASVKVQRATGAPASLVIASEDLWVKLASSSTVVDPAAGPSNATGTATASELRLSISGLNVVLGNQDMAAGHAIVSNRRAGGWFEDGPFSLEAMDVARLGTSVAYWGLAATVVQIPAGIVHIYNAP